MTEKWLIFEQMYGLCMNPTLEMLHKVVPEIVTLKAQSGHLEAKNDIGSIDIKQKRRSDQLMFDIRISFEKEIFDLYFKSKIDPFQDDELLSSNTLPLASTGDDGRSFFDFKLIVSKKSAEMFTSLGV